MELHFRKSGSGHPLVILHGLYGASDNWYTIGRHLADRFTVYLMDLRNHGQSPHSTEHSYPVMAADLAEFFSQQRIGRAHVMGHSMGGKTALAFGLQHPEHISKMIMVDIAPCAYDPATWPEAANHLHIMSALLQLDPDAITTREEADSLLQPAIPSADVRMFLLKNLKRHHGGSFFWSLNLPVLAERLPEILAGVVNCDAPESVSLPEFPLLFIRGQRSNYIRERELDAIHRMFPCSFVTEIPRAGHWVHAEQPGIFLDTVRKFLVN